MARKRKKKHQTTQTVQATMDATDRQGATPERLAKADGHVHLEAGVQYMKDDTLDRALARGRITNREYEAGKKYRHHWYNGGMAGNLKSCNLFGVRAGDDFGTGMPRTTAEAFHRKQYRHAREALARIDVDYVTALENFVCKEIGPTSIGYARGWRNQPQADASAREVIGASLKILAAHYGI